MKRTPSPARRITLILAVVIIMPAFFYSGYMITSMNASEELMGQIYRQQLEVMLSSVNQFSWDVAGSWAGSVAMLAREYDQAPKELRRGTELFLHATRAVRGVVFADTALRKIRIVWRTGVAANDTALTAALVRNSGLLGRLLHFQRLEYRKLEPLRWADRGDSASGLVLMCTTGGGAVPAGLAGLVIDQQMFLQDVVVRRVRESAGTAFVAAVFSGNEQVFPSAPVPGAAAGPRKLLWLFPSLTVGIGMNGPGTDAILRDRFRQNVALIGIVNLVLIAGVWFVYRAVRREMELVRLRSDFISNISHELRTPLSLIRMYAETLEMGRVRDEGKKAEYYGTIVRETERLTHLVNNILNFSRMEAGRRSYAVRPMDLNGVVRSVVATYREHFQASGVEPELQLSPALRPVNGDAEALTEVAINLIENAMKYNNGDPFLRISTLDEEGFGVLEVEDHGIGIEPGQQEKIFEPFYRASDPLVHNTKGAGLGLSLVKHIVEAHSGSVVVNSRPGSGSRFRVRIPLAASRNEST